MFYEPQLLYKAAGGSGHFQQAFAFPQDQIVRKFVYISAEVCSSHSGW
jgi:hypothetical protein